MDACNGDDDDEISRLADKTGNLSIQVDASSNMVEVAKPGFSLPKSLFDKLYDYQREGIAWLWNLHRKSPGGILADDMGLGKTFQVSSL